MNSEDTSLSQGKSFIPLVLISLSVIFFFAWQLSSISTTRGNLMSAKAQWGKIALDSVPNYKKAADTAVHVESVLNQLAGDLYKLSSDEKNPDAVAEKLVKQFGIKYNPPASTPAPSERP